MSIQNAASFQNVTVSYNQEPINPFGMQLIQTSTSTASNVDFLNLDSYPNTTSPYKNYYLVYRLRYSTPNGTALRLAASSTGSTFTQMNVNTSGWLSDVANYNGATALDITNTWSTGNASFWYNYLSSPVSGAQYIHGYVQIIGMNTLYLAGMGLSTTFITTASSGSVYNTGDYICGGGVYANVAKAMRFVNGGGTPAEANYSLFAMPGP